MRTSRLFATVFMIGGTVAGCGGQIGAGDELEHLGPVDGVVHVRRPEGTDGVGETSFGLTAGTNAKAIYLNGIGRTYTAGWDDSVNGVSSVVQGQGKSSATIPAVNMTATQWSQFVSCVKDQFARFNIEVTDKRPATGPYIEASVGGSGAELGYGGGVGGVAPVDTYRCQPIADAVVFIFTQKSWGASPQIACEIAAQEIGHSLVPLDHEMLASDPMTYLSYNGKKTFQDQAARCGEYSERDCYCKKTTQNSVQMLLSTLGPKSSTPPPPPPTGDTTKPTVALTAPANGASIPGNAPITVTATASDNVGVSAVSLYWAYSSRSIPCDAANGCTQSGNTYSWSINVGTGERQFYVTATDAAGNAAQSATHKITLTSAGEPPPPPVDAPPQVRVDAPTSGTVIRPGGALNVQATIKDDGIISKVEMNWTANGTTTAFQMHETGAGVFTFASTLSASAVAGPRSFTVTAFDDKGNKTTSPAVSMTVQP
jgi:hypothetical protein